jgi:hypothetical protein
MKRRNIKSLLIIVAVVIGIAAVFVALTYPRYHREMQAAKARLLAGSEILKTDHGDIEYVVQGEGTPVLSLHGAGGGTCRDARAWASSRRRKTWCRRRSKTS